MPLIPSGAGLFAASDHTPSPRHAAIAAIRWTRTTHRGAAADLIDTEALLTYARMVAATADTMNLPADRQATLKTAAEQLTQAASTPTPDPRHLRGMANNLLATSGQQHRPSPAAPPSPSANRPSERRPGSHRPGTGTPQAIPPHPTPRQGPRTRDTQVTHKDQGRIAR
jgi:hypothetical protein